MANKNPMDPKKIPGSMKPGASGDAAGEALRRLGATGAAGDAAKIAAGAAKGAAGGTAASKAVGGGVQGAAVQGAITAATSTDIPGRAKRGGQRALVALGALAALMIAPTLGGGGGAISASSSDQGVTQERSHAAAAESGYDPETFDNVYSSAGKWDMQWESVAAVAHWQATRNTQRYCPPTTGGDETEPPGDDDSVTEEPGPEDEAVVQLVNGTAHPVTGSTYRVSSTFGTEIVDGTTTSLNTGLDFGDEVGTGLVAASAGTVVYSGWNAAGGNMVWIDLADDGDPDTPSTQLRYMHLEAIQVATGDVLAAGDVIGTMGDTGSATRPTLHFEVLESNEHVDPAVWLEDRGIEVNHGLPVGSDFADPCAAQDFTNPVSGGGTDPGDYTPGEGFPAAPPANCPTAPSGNILGDISVLTPDARRALDCSIQAFPNMLLTSAYRDWNTGGGLYRSDHMDGNALDLAVGEYAEGSAGWAYMYTLAHWGQVNADALGIKYIIFYDWTWDRYRGWHPYEFHGGTNDPSVRHLDHVHFSFNGNSAIPDAQNLIPALADGSGMAWEPKGGATAPPWYQYRFYPIDDPALALENFPTDGSGGLLIGGGGTSFVAGDFRGPYKIDREAFGPETEEDEVQLEQELADDEVFARDWAYRERYGYVSSTAEGAEGLAERAEEDFDFASEWVAFHLHRALSSQGTLDEADLKAGRLIDKETREVTIGDPGVVERVQEVYTNAYAELPLAGMSTSAGGAIFGIAQDWHFGVPSGGGSSGGATAGVVCSPAVGSTLTVNAALDGPRAGEAVVMDEKKLGYAATAVHVAKQHSINENGMVAMLMTILQESTFNMYANSNVPASLNLPHDAVGSDHDSTGLYQQRGAAVGWAWGPLESNMDVSRSTAAFLGVSDESTAPGLTDVTGWETMHPGTLAQSVQVSAYPTHYNQWQGAAEQILGHVEGIPCE